jgi:hypothetical protein
MRYWNLFDKLEALKDFGIQYFLYARIMNIKNVLGVVLLTLGV